MSANYPRNCWYVAATSDELGEGPLGRRLLDTPVVLYRGASGNVVAMEDRCVHRGYPLSLGRVDGDQLVCGHDGFVYDPDGTLVDVPSQDNTPQGVSLRTFPVEEQAPFVWIWLGDPGAATMRRPPRTPWFEDPAWASTGTAFHVAANYLLLHEHYLDLTNVFVMHPEAVPPGIETLPPLDEVEVSEMSVAYRRVLPSARLADWEAEATGLPRDTECLRREEGTFVSPALHVQRYTIEPDGQGPLALLRVQGFTPESAATTHVFLRMVRNYGTDRSVVADHLQTMFSEWAARDVTFLERLQQARVEAPTVRRDLNVKADRAALKARRVALSMVEEEAGRHDLARR